jgi:hypothetical protein
MLTRAFPGRVCPRPSGETESIMASPGKNFQLVWGIVLVLAGLGVFYRIPQVMPRVREITYFSGIMPFIYFCFYLMGAILVGGGIKKIVDTCRRRDDDDQDSA